MNDKSEGARRLGHAVAALACAALGAVYWAWASHVGSSMLYGVQHAPRTLDGFLVKIGCALGAIFPYWSASAWGYDWEMWPSLQFWAVALVLPIVVALVYGLVVGAKASREFLPAAWALCGWIVVSLTLFPWFSGFAAPLALRLAGDSFMPSVRIMVTGAVSRNLVAMPYLVFWVLLATPKLSSLIVDVSRRVNKRLS
ncbi:MAG: hypothetical protein KJ747_04520 [Actinobacteria bacterium]|nr:hypothetical protein [Actinomycetota bacterium]MCG2807532.1 hypothetical protein [Coriobacteriia bacterium]